MKRMICGALLLFAVFLNAQEQRPPRNPPPYSTPPTFPEVKNPSQRMPPDTAAPPQKLSTAEVQEQVQKKLGTEPALQGSDVAAAVDDSSVILTGTVDDQQQHALALRIAQSYAGERQIVDRIHVRGQTS